jgi:hypothetical protein
MSRIHRRAVPSFANVSAGPDPTNSRQGQAMWRAFPCGADHTACRSARGATSSGPAGVSGCQPGARRVRIAEGAGRPRTQESVHELDQAGTLRFIETARCRKPRGNEAERGRAPPTMSWSETELISKQGRAVAFSSRFMSSGLQRPEDVALGGCCRPDRVDFAKPRIVRVCDGVESRL